MKGIILSNRDALAFQRGFTLVELVTVIVLLGIITAVAAPRFVELSGAAQQASTKAVAGSLGSSSALNHATDILVRANKDPSSGPPAPVPIESCEDANVELLLTAGIPDGYSIEAGTGPSSVGVGEATTCFVVFDEDPSVRASFTLHGTGGG